MKYVYSFFIIFFIATNSLFSQIKIVDNADLSNFPEIEFSINNRNPTLLSPSSFNISELINGRLIESDSVTIYRSPNDSAD